MTDKEIIKALECCACSANLCDECPVASTLKDDCKCGEYLAKHSLDLINRQQAEIERLEGILNTRCEHCPRDNTTEGYRKQNVGKWVCFSRNNFTGVAWYKCSICKRVVRWKSDFCPNCGANMQEKCENTPQNTTEKCETDYSYGY